MAGFHLIRSLVLAGIGAGLVGSASMAAADGAKTRPGAYTAVLAAEGKSRALCESVPLRVFVSTAEGSECVAYFVTKGQETKRQAVMFFDGDMPAETYADPAAMERALANTKAGLQTWADKLKVPYVMVSRIGLNGSSGNHGDRRRPRETHIMNAAIDLLKAKLGIERIGLAGQSGGSTISASLLSLGRRDIACAALGSGAFEVVDLHHKSLIRNGRTVAKSVLQKGMYDPASHVGDIPADARRRVFIIGDTTDTRTPFDQQQRYAEALLAAGHHAVLVAIEATGDLDHSAARYAVPTAGGCLIGTKDAQLIKANAGQTRRIDIKEAAATPATTGSAAMLKSSLQAGR